MTTEAKKKKRPRDLSLLARSIVEDATGEKFPSIKPAKEEKEEKPKNPHAQALGRLGGSKGGKASAENLPPKKDLNEPARLPRSDGRKRHRNLNKSSIHPQIPLIP